MNTIQTSTNTIVNIHDAWIETDQAMETSKMSPSETKAQHSKLTSNSTFANIYYEFCQNPSLALIWQPNAKH